MTRLVSCDPAAPADILAAVPGGAVAGLLTAEPGTAAALRFCVAPAAVADPPATSFPPRSSPPGVALAQMSARSPAAAPRSTRAKVSAHRPQACRPQKRRRRRRRPYVLRTACSGCTPGTRGGPLRGAEVDRVLLPLSAKPCFRLRRTAGAAHGAPLLGHRHRRGECRSLPGGHLGLRYSATF